MVFIKVLGVSCARALDDLLLLLSAEKEEAASSSSSSVSSGFQAFLAASFEELYSVFGIALLPCLSPTSSSSSTLSNAHGPGAEANQGTLVDYILMKLLPFHKYAMATTTAASIDTRGNGNTRVRGGTEKSDAHHHPIMLSPPPPPPLAVSTIEELFMFSRQLLFLWSMFRAPHLIDSVTLRRLQQLSSWNETLWTMSSVDGRRFAKDCDRWRDALSFPADADVLVPVALVSELGAAGGSVSAFCQNRPKPSTTKDGVEEEQWCRVVILPRRSPVNTNRIAKNARLALIQSLTDAREYNKMVQTAGFNSQLSVSQTLQASKKRVKSAGGVPTTSAGGSSDLIKDLERLSGKDNEDASSASGNQNGRRQQKESYASFMKDISLGMDMRLMSFAGCIVGYYVCYSRGQSVDMCIVGAAVGTVIMMLVDAVLLIIRLAREDEGGRKKKPSSAAAVLDVANQLQPQDESKLQLETKKKQ